MSEIEHTPIPEVNSGDKPREFHVAHDTQLGTLLNVFVEEDDLDTDDPRMYTLHLSVGRKPITHAPRLDVISSEPPLPGYESRDEYKVSLDTAKIRIRGKIGLNAAQGSVLNGMGFIVHDISRVQQPN
ncbi:MAG: hypothetical protein JWN26_653 [Candidatus Saccharibacteria bacterium]|nr:hypothetical protein [Candidatus Saccharibacteria bacterium]